MSEARAKMIEDIWPMVEGFFDREGEVAPFFVANLDGGERPALIMTPWSNEAEKAAVVANLRELFAERHASSYIQVSEVWMKAFRADSVRLDKAPSEYEDKEELVMVLAVDSEGSTMVAREIIRPFDGKAPFLAPPREAMENVGGRMAELLP